MKPQKQILLSALVGVMVLGINIDTWAQGRGRGRGFGNGRGCGFRALENLDLSEEQRQNLELLRAEHRQVITQLEAELDVLRDQMHALMAAENLDRQAIEAKRDEMEPIRQRIRNQRHKHRLDMLEQLTAQQRTELQSNRAKYKGKRKGWGRGQGQGRGRGGCPWAQQSVTD